MCHMPSYSHGPGHYLHIRPSAHTGFWCQSPRRRFVTCSRLCALRSPRKFAVPRSRILDWKYRGGSYLFSRFDSPRYICTPSIRNGISYIWISAPPTCNPYLIKARRFSTRFEIFTCVLPLLLVHEEMKCIINLNRSERDQLMNKFGFENPRIGDKNASRGTNVDEDF